MGWFAIKSNDPSKVASTVGLRSSHSANWQEGIEAAYEKGLVFVTPPVRDWVCIVGNHAAERNDRAPVEAISKDVVQLSSTFGEAQGFASHRVVEYHHWMLAKKGRLLRCFAYVGDRGEILAISGELTEVERQLRLFGRSLQRPPNEDDVMVVAAGWSFNPTELTERSAPPAMGLLGKL